MGPQLFEFKLKLFKNNQSSKQKREKKVFQPPPSRQSIFRRPFDQNCHELWSQIKLKWAASVHGSLGIVPWPKGAGQLGKCLKTKCKQVSHQRLARHRNRIKTCTARSRIIMTASLKRLHIKIDPKGPHLRIRRMFKSATYQNKMSYQRKYKKGALWLAGR